MTITEKRAKSVLVSEGYLNTDFQFVVREDAPEIADMDGFKDKIIAVNKGSVYDSWARERAAEMVWTVESYGTNTDAVLAVVSGRAFANVAGNTVSAWAAKQNPAVQLSYLVSTGKVWEMPFRKDDAALRPTVERTIECLKTDGTMAALHEKWFGSPPAPGAAAVTPMAGTASRDLPAMWRTTTSSAATDPGPPVTVPALTGRTAAPRTPRATSARAASSG